MQDRFKYTNRLVVSFVIMGFILLIAFSLLVLIKNKTLENKVFYHTILDNGSGLSSKPPIYFKGFEIGRIDDFELVSNTNKILVKFFIYENYIDKIIKYAVISRIETLVLGASNQYEILLPKQDLIAQLEPLPEGGLVPFISSELGQLYAKKGQIPVKRDSIESILSSVNEVLTNLQRESDSEAGAIFKTLDKVSQIADSYLAMAQQAEEDQLIPEIKKTIYALQALIKSSDSSIVKTENAIEKISKMADAYSVIAQQADKVQLVPEIKNTIIALQTLIDSSSSTIVKADTAIARANSFFSSAEDVAKHTDSLLVEYEDPAEIISRASDYKIPGMIENVDVNLLYLQDILKEVHLQREQLATAIISLNKTLKTFDKTLQGVNNNPLFKGGIDAVNKPDNSIEVNEN